MKKLSLKALIWLALILLIVWFFRPFFHSFAMMFWVSPLRAILIIALLVGIVLFFKRLGKISFVQTGMQNYSLKASNKISPLLVFGYIAGLVILLIALNFESEIRYLITSKQVDYETKADLPGFDPIRLTPKPVAERYADDTFQNPQEHLGDSQIIMKDGKLLRVYPRLPDGGLLFFLNKLG